MYSINCNLQLSQVDSSFRAWQLTEILFENSFVSLECYQCHCKCYVVNFQSDYIFNLDRLNLILVLKDHYIVNYDQSIFWNFFYIASCQSLNFFLNDLHFFSKTLWLSHLKFYKFMKAQIYQIFNYFDAQRWILFPIQVPEQSFFDRMNFFILSLMVLGYQILKLLCYFLVASFMIIIKHLLF